MSTKLPYKLEAVVSSHTSWALSSHHDIARLRRWRDGWQS